MLRICRVKLSQPSTKASVWPRGSAPRSCRAIHCWGWTDFGGRNYLVRQLNDHKASLDVTTLDETGLAEYASVCGEMLARGHARSGSAGDIHEFVGEGKHFSKAMLAFATAYAVQTVEDWKALLVSRKG